MRCARLFFVLFAFFTLEAQSRDREVLILRGRVPASIIDLDLDHFESGELSLDQIKMNTSSTKYSIKIEEENQYQIVNIVFH